MSLVRLAFKGGRSPLLIRGYNFPTNRHFSVSSSLKSIDEGSWISDGATVSSSLVEPTFRELGLGIHGTILPHGLLQSFLENAHVSMGIPWWESIVITTLILRGLVFPIILKTQKNMIHMASHQPEIDRLRMEALKETDPVLRKAGTIKLMTYMQENKIFPLKMYTPILANGFVMASMFFAIRGLTNVPVQSMTTGGCQWFVDLTTADPTYALPALASFTVLLQVQLGADGLDKSGVPPALKKFLYIMPAISFPIMTQFPSALCLYWVTSNIISLVQSSLLRIPSVKKALNIGEVKKSDNKT